MKQNLLLFTTAFLILSTCVVQGRVVGGGAATDGEYPAYVHTVAGYLCGGTLIHKDIVMTTASCAPAFAVGTPVYIGAINVFGTGDERTFVEQIYKHPNFNQNGFYENDIMLFKLETPSAAPVVKLNRDAAVPLKDSKVDAIGFGYTQDPKSVPTASVSASLMEVQLTVQDFQTCSVDFPGIQYASTQICAGETSSKGICNGDSGGPLFAAGSNVQVGIVSYFGTCTRPAVYTRVSAFIDFIEDAICEMSSDPRRDALRQKKKTILFAFALCAVIYLVLFEQISVKRINGNTRTKIIMIRILRA